MKTSRILMLTLSMALTGSVATAQVNKGTWMIGATSAFNFSNLSFKKGSDLSIFSVNARAGYFVVDNFALGLNLGLSTMSQDNSSQTSTIAGVFTRYYFPKSLYLGAGINSVSSSFKYGSNNEDASSVAFPLELGIAIFVTKNVAIEPSINYTIGDEKGGVIYYGQNSGASSALGLNIGLAFYLNRN